VGCILGPWVFFLLFLFGFFRGCFCLGSFVGCFWVVGFFLWFLLRFPQVSFGFSCVRKGALRFFNNIFAYLSKKKITSKNHPFEGIQQNLSSPPRPTLQE